VMSRRKAEGITDARKELDASKPSHENRSRARPRQNDNDDHNVDDGSIARAGRACRRPHPVLQIVPNSALAHPWDRWRKSCTGRVGGRLSRAQAAGITDALKELESCKHR